MEIKVFIIINIIEKKRWELFNIRFLKMILKELKIQAESINSHHGREAITVNYLV